MKAITLSILVLFLQSSWALDSIRNRTNKIKSTTKFHGNQEPKGDDELKQWLKEIKNEEANRKPASDDRQKNSSKKRLRI